MPYLEELEPQAQNAKRAAWAEDAVNVFARETYAGRTFTNTVVEQPDERGDAYTMIQDLLCDLLHLAKAHDWNVDDMIRRARDSFDYEASPDYAGD